MSIQCAIKCPIEKIHKVFKYIEHPHPSKEMKLAAVQQNGSLIKYIKNPTERVQMIAVIKNPYCIRFIKKPSEIVQLASVRNIPESIRYIKKPSESVQLDAVREDPESIQYIKKPTERVQLVAVQEDPESIQYIKKPSDLVKIYLQLDGWKDLQKKRMQQLKNEIECRPGGVQYEEIINRLRWQVVEDANFHDAHE